MKNEEGKTKIPHVSKSPSINSSVEVEGIPLVVISESHNVLGPSQKREGPKDAIVHVLQDVSKYFLQGCVPGIICAIALIFLVTRVEMTGSSGALWKFLLM